MLAMDKHGNRIAREGCDRCICGCKYWEFDKCVDCGTHIKRVPCEICESTLRDKDGNLLHFEDECFK